MEHNHHLQSSVLPANICDWDGSSFSLGNTCYYIDANGGIPSVDRLYVCKAVGKKYQQDIRFILVNAVGVVEVVADVGCVLIMSSSQSYGSNTTANISFTSDSYSGTSTFWSAGTPANLTITTPGKYYIWWNVKAQWGCFATDRGNIIRKGNM